MNDNKSAVMTMDFFCLNLFEIILDYHSMKNLLEEKLEISMKYDFQFELDLFLTVIHPFTSQL